MYTLFFTFALRYGIWMNRELGMSCWMPVCFWRSIKRSLPFTLLTLGTADPSGIYLIETGAGKKWLVKHSSKLFESHHKTLNHCITLFVVSTEKFCSEGWSLSHSNLQYLLQHFWHHQPLQGSCQEQFLPKLFTKILPAALKICFSWFVSVVFLDKFKCVPNLSCGSKILDRVSLNGAIPLYLCLIISRQPWYNCWD